MRQLRKSGAPERLLRVIHGMEKELGRPVCAYEINKVVGWPVANGILFRSLLSSYVRQYWATKFPHGPNVGWHPSLPSYGLTDTGRKWLANHPPQN